MKQLLITACIFSFATMGCDDTKKESTTTLTDAATTVNTASDSAATVATPPVDSATMMKNWQSYMTPSDPHKMMASWNGNWTGEVIMWHAPGGPADTSKATTVNKMVMGGRYQVSNTSGNMMGMPFEGTSTLAYDNHKKTFISTWIDNMGTGMMILEGPWDESSKTMTLSGKCVDPGAGTGKEMNIRETFRVVDDKTQVMEMFGPGPDGREFKMMQINFTRK